MILPIILIITIVYLALIGSLIIGFDRLPQFHLNDKKPSLKFTIIIPFRNESKNLAKLLRSLDGLNYPKSLFEVLFINDESSDQSVDVIKKWQNKSSLDLKVIDTIRKTSSPKKDAISLGVIQANNEWIVSSDADCQVPKFWLDAYDDFLTSNHLKMAVAPISYSDLSSFFKRLQALDILSLQGSTMGGFGIGKPFLCNAANMAYSKQFFHELKGFQGNTEIASGDDIFILEKALKSDKNSVGFLKNEQAIVHTGPEASWKDLKNQRLRWASKTRHYRNNFGKLIGMIVFLMNATIICNFLLVAVGLMTLKFAFYIFLIKLMIDFLLIYKSSRFFNQESLLPTYLFAGIMYPFYSCYIAILSVFKKFSWKERQFSK